jgi:hypothetical protein
MSHHRALLLASLCVPVCACSPGKLDLGGPTSTYQAPIGPDDVVGIVQRQDGAPLTVNVLSGTTLTQTDANGRFVLRNAPARYDVSFAAAPGTPPGPEAFVYLGLTTRHPTLTVPTGHGPTWSGPPTSSLKVTYPPPTAVETRHLLFLDLPVDVGTVNLDPFPTMNNVGPYPIDMLPGASSADANVASLTFTGQDGVPPANYLGYATASVHLEAGATTSWTPTYAPVDSMTVTGSPTLEDPAQTLFQSYLYASLSKPGETGSWAAVSLDAPAQSPPYSFVVPKVPGISWAIQFNAYGPGGPGSSGGASTWAYALVGSDGTVSPVRIPAPPRTVSPPSGTTGFGFGAVLTWTGEGVCTATVFPADTLQTFAWFLIVSNQETATIPDTTALGVTFPPLTTYAWGVSCAQSSLPPLGADPVLLPNDALASGGYSLIAPAPTVITK